MNSSQKTFDPEYGKHWFFWALAVVILLATACFPPQRQAADWFDHRGHKVKPSFETLELDRFEFGYLPRFASPRNIGRLEPPEFIATSTVSTPSAGPYQYQSTAVRWVVDWQWVGAAIVLAAMLSLVGWQFARTYRSPISN